MAMQAGGASFAPDSEREDSHRFLMKIILLVKDAVEWEFVSTDQR